MDTKALLADAIQSLKSISSTPVTSQAFVGLDGYVDKIQKVVQSQIKQQSTYFPTIAALAAHIDLAAGKSAQLELVTQETKLGGNAPIMAHALGSLGLPTTCLGNFGFPDIDLPFQQMHAQCQLVSLGPPAETNALEFDDGKLILSEVSAFKMLDWKMVKEVAGISNLIAYVEPCALVALVDWCNLPHATDIWRGILEEVLPQLTARPRHFFFDLADPSKKPVEEVLEVLEVIKSFAPYGTVTLGLNENEANKLTVALHDNPSLLVKPLVEKCAFIYDQLTIHRLLVHPVDSSVLVTEQGSQIIPGRLVTQPRISTGGGDNLNAGFCFGQLAGFSLETSAVLGMATSGAYVQDGKSPDVPRLLTYLEEWLAAVS
jgi:hypothetical protein